MCVGPLRISAFLWKDLGIKSGIYSKLKRGLSGPGAASQKFIPKCQRYLYLHFYFYPKLIQHLSHQRHEKAKVSNSPPCLALKVLLLLLLCYCYCVIVIGIVLLLFWKEKEESEVVWGALKSVIAKAQKFLRGKSYHGCNRLSPKFHKNFHQLINSLLRRGRSHTKVDRVHKYQTSSSCSLYNYIPALFMWTRFVFLPIKTFWPTLLWPFSSWPFSCRLADIGQLFAINYCSRRPGWSFCDTSDHGENTLSRISSPPRYNLRHFLAPCPLDKSLDIIQRRLMLR